MSLYFSKLAILCSSGRLSKLLTVLPSMQSGSSQTISYQRFARAIDLRCTVLELSLMQHRNQSELKEHLLDLIMDASVPMEILALNNSNFIRGFLNVLQKALDFLRSQPVHPDTQSLLVRCEEMLLHISYKSDVLPSILFLRDIKPVGMHPVTGGGWSDVWKGVLHGRVVALKVLRDCHVRDEVRKTRLRKKFHREALIWRQLCHPNIHPFLGIFDGLHNPSLVSPWRSRGHLLAFLKSQSGQQYDRAMILGEIASALAYLHSLTPPLVHGDIKAVSYVHPGLKLLIDTPEPVLFPQANVLVDSTNRPCLVDFGISKFVRPAVSRPPPSPKIYNWDGRVVHRFRHANESLSDTMTHTSHFHGTLRWMPPEAFMGTYRGSTAGDMYSFGCLCLEVYTLEHPWREERNEAAIIARSLAGQRPMRPQEVPSEVWAIMQMVWQQDPEERQTAPWIEWLLAGISDQYPETSGADDQPAVYLDK
ncbi:kinase-like protein [Neolentinus lepideus HHB14362 ss-1]|uniref:Kinase-like protein n=1 Tax=Neolentinus lepideus HHB14362 ss-1 TaxID=1314782 RepID=A0A165S1N3_9AGAM|nr:kinase-like protein [Neolentinus lepideus HHB14362 ss-1]